MSEIRPGVKSSEWYTNLIAIIAIATLAVYGKISGDLALSAILGVAGVYTGSRTFIKARNNAGSEPPKRESPLAEKSNDRVPDRRDE